MTHLHTDRVGWNTVWRENRREPLFPDARYICSEKELMRVKNSECYRNWWLDSLLPVIEAGHPDRAGLILSSGESDNLLQPHHQGFGGINRELKPLQALHDTIACNHQCRLMWQPLEKFCRFTETVSPFPEANMGWQKCSGIRRSYLNLWRFKNMFLICFYVRILFLF